MPYPAQLMSMRTTGFLLPRKALCQHCHIRFVCQIKRQNLRYAACRKRFPLTGFPRLAISQNSSTECSPRSSRMANSRPIPLEAPVITTIFHSFPHFCARFLHISNLSLFRLFTRLAALFSSSKSARASFPLKSVSSGRGHPSTDVLNTRLRCQLPASIRLT